VCWCLPLQGREGWQLVRGAPAPALAAAATGASPANLTAPPARAATQPPPAAAPAAAHKLAAARATDPYLSAALQAAAGMPAGGADGDASARATAGTAAALTAWRDAAERGQDTCGPPDSGAAGRAGGAGEGAATETADFRAAAEAKAAEAWVCARLPGPN